MFFWLYDEFEHVLANSGVASQWELMRSDGFLFCMTAPLYSPGNTQNKDFYCFVTFLIIKGRQDKICSTAGNIEPGKP